MIIEKLNKNDMAQYKALIDECFGSSNGIDEYINGYDENSTSYEVIVAKDSGQIVGSITLYKISLFTFSFQPALEVFNVCVANEHRGKKIAKQLFEYVIEDARGNGYKSISLTCLDTAYDAHYLYEALGFKKASSLKYNLSF